jgi:uncharacterized glyoxalase superfamily protein PhnB
MTGLPGGTLNHLNPILNVNDLETSIVFYRENLGFELLHTFGDPPSFAIIRRDTHEIYLCHQGQGQPGTWLGLFVTDSTALHAHLVANGAKLLDPPDTTGEYRLEDPDGHILRIFPS